MQKYLRRKFRGAADSVIALLRMNKMAHGSNFVSQQVLEAGLSDEIREELKELAEAAGKQL